MNKLAVLACIMIACGGTPAQPSTPRAEVARPARGTGPGEPAHGAPASLYDRLGGQRAIVAVIDDFIDRVAADARIKFRFLNTDLPKLKTLLVEFVCMATGGPCKYTGQDMETSHAGMELVDDEFTALVEDLAGALDKFKVPAKEKGELLGALGPLQAADRHADGPAEARRRRADREGDRGARQGHRRQRHRAHAGGDRRGEARPAKLRRPAVQSRRDRSSVRRSSRRPRRRFAMARRRASRRRSSRCRRTRRRSPSSSATPTTTSPTPGASPR